MCDCKKTVKIDKELIRAKRKEMGYTIRTVAYLLEVCPSFYGRMERGVYKNTSKERYAKLLKILEIEG